MLYGRYIDAQRIMKNAGKGDAPPLVPASWQLIRQPPDGAESVCATSVLSFDLCDDGSLVYTHRLTRMFSPHPHCPAGRARRDWPGGDDRARRRAGVVKPGADHWPFNVIERRQIAAAPRNRRRSCRAGRDARFTRFMLR